MNRAILTILFTAATAFSAVPNAFNSGKSVVAREMNDNFTYLDTIVAKKADKSYVDSSVGPKADSNWVKQKISASLPTSAALTAANNLKDLTDTAAARKNLGLGSLATMSLLTAADVGAIPTTSASSFLSTSGGTVKGNITAPMFTGMINSFDSRSVVTTPGSTDQGVTFAFKTNETEKLVDGGAFFGEMTFRPYGGSIDFSGGPAHQLGFSSNGNLWHRFGYKDSWGSWRQIAYTGKVMGLNGGTITGDLHIAGNLTAKPNIPVADYVFEPDYKLTALSEVEAYTKQHKHLPEVPSATEIEKGGLDLAQMNLVLLKKVEELTLHAIEQQKALQAQDAHNAEQKREIAELREMIKSIKTR